MLLSVWRQNIRSVLLVFSQRQGKKPSTNYLSLCQRELMDRLKESSAASMRRELYRQPFPKSFTLSKQFLPLVWKQKEHFLPQDYS
ncbi:Tbc1 domain family member 24-like protein [Caligus rogercresseyi]|uniref:Tbc1 domain family member 24-like protein n=1 Tax=Caligus rogercresseyi TaxID=217165 RepID=A0A7T8GLI5_CALRO|nr:Tbc1 domain family member 24-like protein [Caligus rogercresseyi]